MVCLRRDDGGSGAIGRVVENAILNEGPFEKSIAE